MMKDIINLDDSNKNLNVSKEKVDILIREIKAKGKKIIKVYNSFSQVDPCSYSLIQLYKLTEQNINYKDNEYRFFTTMNKSLIFQWNNHENILKLSQYILNENLLTIYFKYMKFKDNKIFSSLRKNVKIEELNIAINKLSALLNNSFALLPPIYSNIYSEDFINSDIYNKSLSEEELENEVKRINFNHNGHLITKYTNNNISYWIKGLIYRDKKNEAFNKYYAYEREIFKQFKENIDCLNIYIKSFKFLKPVLIEEEYKSLSKYILNEDEFSLYLKKICNKLMKYRNYISIINRVTSLDEEVLHLLDFIYTNTKSINEGEQLLSFINKYYYYMLINNIEKNNQYISEYSSVEDYFNILIKAVKFTNKILNNNLPLENYLNELFNEDVMIELNNTITTGINYESEILSLLKSWGYKIMCNFHYDNYTLRYIVFTKENPNNFVPIYFDSISEFNENSLKEILYLLANSKDILFIWSRDWWYKRNSETIRIRSFLNRIL
ncbi:hypothetical protein [Clostridium sp.]|uniref:hypothetical protein n=1 Tax=Clostridium sp. TaxID=1506 RepID=UPI0026722974|nr:hypothetical protein [Clostridium sp.]MEE0567471.1 hypothetical protein [Clostridium sp.]